MPRRAGTRRFSRASSARPGHVIAHNHPGARAALAAEDFEARYGGNRLPNVEQIFVRHNDLRLPSGSVDVVLMSMVYHDTYWHDDKVDWGPIDRQALLESLLAALETRRNRRRRRPLRRGRHGSVRVRHGRAPHRSSPSCNATSSPRASRPAGESDVLRTDDRRLLAERVRSGRRRPHRSLRATVSETARRSTLSSQGTTRGPGGIPQPGAESAGSLLLRACRQPRPIRRSP